MQTLRKKGVNMRQSYENEQIGQLLAVIKSESAAIRKEDEEKFQKASEESFKDLCDVFRRVTETLSKEVTQLDNGKGFITGNIGEWSFWISGNKYDPEISLFKEHTLADMTIEPLENKYKLTFLTNRLSTVADRKDTIKAIAYFLTTEKPTPSLIWIADPDVVGWAEAKELGWC